MIINFLGGLSLRLLLAAGAIIFSTHSFALGLALYWTAARLVVAIERTGNVIVAILRQIKEKP